MVSSSPCDKPNDSILAACRALFAVPCWHIGQVVSLTRDLLGWLLAGPTAWIGMTLRLLCFTAILTPGWIKLLGYYLFAEGVIKNVPYSSLGARSRNLLDIYLPSTSSTITSSDSGAPVVIFVSGGAWIIGYKLWSCLVARSLASMGVLVLCIDYRNFPQGDIEDMADDVRAAVAWTVGNCSKYGGSAKKIVLAGQSAGAHICLSALLDAFETNLAPAAATPAATPASAAATTASDLATDTTDRVHPLTLQAVRQLEAVLGGPLLSPTPHANEQQQVSPQHARSPKTWRDIPTPTPAKLASKGHIPASPATLLSPSAPPRPLSPHNARPAVDKDHDPSPAPAPALDLSAIKLFVGVSGPYDLITMADHMHGRGLDASILRWICRGDLEHYSPTRRVLRRVAAEGGLTEWLGDREDPPCPPSSPLSPSFFSSAASPSSASGYGLRTLPFASFPPCALFHGRSDLSVPVAISAALASALEAGGARVHLQAYAGLSHTDPILEGPLGGDATLMVDMMGRIHAAVGTCPRAWAEARAGLERRGGPPAMVHPALVSIAKSFNPF